MDGKDVDYIYDEDGDNIARVRNGNKVYPDLDIQLEHDRLITNMNLSQNDNEGRHIADRTETITMSDEEKQNGDIPDKNQLPNLIASKVKIDSSTAIIDLYSTIYNGRRLRDLLAIESKLKDRVPAGADIKSLIYLSVVNSNVLPEKEGKERESDVTCVIMDDPINPNYMVELDETILKPRANLSKQENITADKTSERLGDGMRRKGTTTTTNTKQMSTFEIPGAGAIVGQPDDLLTLEIRQNPNYIDESISQRNDAHNVEISIGVQNISKTENELQHGLNTQSVKLEAYDEVRNIKEIEQQRDFANYKGVNDEYEYNYYNEIDRIFKEVAEEKYHVRDAEELNKNLKEELNKHIEEMKIQEKNGDAITSEITNIVRNRLRYWEIAHDIADNDDIYGYHDVYEKICQIEKEFKKENINLSDYKDDEIKRLVQENFDQEKPRVGSTYPN